MKIVSRFTEVMDMIKWTHSIFALPFALASAWAAAQGIPETRILLLIILCMVLARNTAMAFNRLVDASFDAQNPRTAIRQIPSGVLSKKFVWVFILLNAVCFILATYWINSLAFYLSPLALAVVCFYSLTKRFTHYAQIFLGLSLGIAPIAAWIAVKGNVELFPILMGLGVLFWVAGFDIIYATLDHDFDKKSGLYSLVVRFGITGSLKLARLFHALSIGFLGYAGWAQHWGVIYFGAVGVIALILMAEHRLVGPNNLTRVNTAFFTFNGVVGILYFIGVVLEIYC